MVYRKDINITEEENPTSRINAAGLINSTLEKLWNESYTAMSNGNYLIWNTKLDCIWAILGGDVEEGKDEDKVYSKINLEIYKNGSLKAKVGDGFEKKDNPNNAMQYLLLIKKALFLRRLQNKQGKGTAYDNPDNDDFE